MKFMKKLLFLSVFMLLVTVTVKPVKAATNLEVHFIDVGQADSIYFKLPNGENLLIDAGNNADGPLVVSYLQSQGVTRLDYVIGTHPHEDHIGGLDDVINAFEIGEVYLPNKTATTITYNDVLNAIAAKNLTITTAKAGVVLFDTLANNLMLKAVILSPISATYSDTNDYSAVVRLTYGSTSYMLSGDAETLVENELINSGVNLQADVLKVGHHGSASSTSQAFLDAVNPKIGIISVGANNTYGHPYQEVVDRLIAKELDVYRTDLQGTIVTISDGTTITTNILPWYDGTQTDTDPTPTDPPVDPPTVEGIVINEVLPAPQSLYTQEWVELYNTTSTPVDISGYIIDDLLGGGSAPKTIPQGTIIPANGYYTMYLSSVLNNTGDDVNLLRADGTLLDSYTYGSSTSDQSWYRETNGGVWSTTQNEVPTPDASNTGTIVVPELTILINEVLAAPQSVYTTEWVELYNPTTAGIDISGYIIDDIANGGSAPKTIPQGTIIPANGYYTMYLSSVLNNTGDDVNLMKPDGTVIDSFTYGSSSYDQSWYRETDGGVWSLIQDETPTPGAANDSLTEPVSPPKGGGKKK